MAYGYTVFTLNMRSGWVNSQHFLTQHWGNLRVELLWYVRQYVLV